MGLKYFREKISDIDIIYFFMPPVLGVRMPVATAQGEDGNIIPQGKVCEVCKSNLKAKVRDASVVSEQQQLRREVEEEVGLQKDEEGEEG